ncbi:glycosyltransferase [Jannaschia seohaensis]|uniref:UDP-N-acetylglucosamine transferase subunit ALG13 n=1 Tax=Jannaschia seohaensis TaxID=475081 RepID=A0A2Y9B2C5_9RHOB|nr:glycosyltransferase [Jannaschia seohaensis]PWJ12882.1 UDP-N-acetylglucosamine transferase subunit ALG13 [Jannaschia seohaensis]SSA50690.1 UDP-N-acetylglucosamine transferase subunit ALG13 [Jannaschia seohaensis]
MIFAVTGTQLPFPRLMAALDALPPGERIVAQTGPDPAAYPRLETFATLPPARFDALFAEARVVVAHAGIGSVLSARAQGRPLIVVPRRADLGEHRNDHQLATARALESRAGLRVLWDLADLGAALAEPPAPPPATGSAPLAALRAHLADLIDGS